MLHKKFQLPRLMMTTLKTVALFCSICLAVSSCKKNELSTLDALSAKIGAGAVSYVETANKVKLNGTSYAFTPVYVGVTIKLNAAAGSADTINAVVDPTLVDSYNTIYSEKNLALPTNAFTVSRQGVFPVAANATQTIDSMYVLLNDGTGLKDSTVYLVPVTLTTKKGSQLKYSVFFFKVLVVNVGDLQAKINGATGYPKTTAFGSLNTITSPATAQLGAGAILSLGAQYPDSVKFSTSINSPFPIHDLNVQAVLLTSDEVKAAITVNGWSGSLPFPDGTYSLTNSLLTVPSGASLSKDSITVRLANRASLVSFQYYVMGVKIKTYTGSQYGAPPVVKDSSARAFLRIFLF